MSERSAAISSVRREEIGGGREVCLRERDERVTGEIFSKKKDCGDERVTEKDER